MSELFSRTSMSCATWVYFSYSSTRYCFQFGSVCSLQVYNAPSAIILEAERVEESRQRLDVDDSMVIHYCMDLLVCRWTYPVEVILDLVNRIP
jgi:hypothetical protein